MDEKLPQVVSSGTLKIADLEIIVHMLDDGRCIIPEEDMIKVLQWLENG